mgnify:FL=1
MLNFLSSSELNFKKHWKNGLEKLSKLNNHDKFFTYAWILGPFIYLLERDPADIWLTSISIFFIIRCFKTNEWIWVSQTWFILALLLWIIGILSSIFGPYTILTIKDSVTWIRFPLYAAAAQVWLGRDKDIRMIMFLSIFYSMITIMLILLIEIIFENKDRLIWPFGDPVTGSYLSKISLLVFCVIITLIHRDKTFSGILNFIIGYISLFFIFLTGERVSFLIKFCSAIFAHLSWKTSKKILIYSLILLFSIICILSIFNIQKDKVHRFTTTFYNNIPILNTQDNNSYWGAWRSGIQQGLEAPILGYGPSSSRHHCKNLPGKNPISNPDANFREPQWLPGLNYCGNHPHNFYIQLFAETGIIGLLVGMFMFGSIIYLCFKERLNHPNCHIISLAYIVPLALFFPIQQAGNFYGQWSNLFTWFAIGFAVSQCQSIYNR